MFQAISSPGLVKINDEIPALKQEVKLLKEKGINIIIAVGHSGYIRDQEIAKKIPDIDLIIGGHSNTFLYNGIEPSIETSIGDYPTVIQISGGKKVFVAQAYAYSKYLGSLDFIFDEEGNAELDGKQNPILLDAEFPRGKFYRSYQY